MVISNCESPVRVFNQKLQSFVYVPCGKCVYCRSSKSYAWKRRLDAEMLHYAYTLQITLTYDNAHLPTVTIFPDRRIVYDQFEDKPIEGYLPIDIYDDLQKYYNKDSYGNYTIPICLHRDINQFVLTLKSQIYVRYYIQSEIGPTTLRPHYHGLLFSNEDPEKLISIVCQAWQKCDWSIHRQYLHLADSSSYCTSYVASTVNYPKIFRYLRFSMFSSKSVNPPLGSESYSTKDIESFKSAKVIRTALFNNAKSEYVDVPFLRYHENRYFPKLPRDCNLTDSARHFLYKSYDFARFLFPKESVFHYRQYLAVFERLLFASDSFYKGLDKVLTSNSSVYRLYLASKKYCQIWSNVHPLYRDYLFEEHEYRLRMQELREQYEYEEDFCNKRGYSPCYLIYKDLEFVNTYKDEFGFAPLWVELTLQGYGFSSMRSFTAEYWRFSTKFNPLESAYHRSIDDFIRKSHKSNANNSYLTANGHPAYMHSGL